MLQNAVTAVYKEQEMYPKFVQSFEKFYERKEK